MANFALIYGSELKKSIWRGYPDPNYVWDGDRLVWERTVKDENDKDVTVKTYKDPIEIIADFKPDSKVYGVEGNIGRKAVETFGGGLKGFVWLDKISGSGEVILPFTAKHIFIAKGDRFNPELTEIGTDSNEDNYYEVVEGKTRVFVKSFSGVGGAAGVPPTLIAHYKFNEDTAGDNAELIGGGDFATGDWVGDDPDPTYWVVTGEVTTDPECSEVGTGQAHGGAGTGYCNFYTTGDLIKITQDINLVIGRKYRFSVNVDTITTGGLKIEIGASGVDFNGFYSGSETGTQGGTFVAVTGANTSVELRRNTGATDITFDDVSIKLLAVEDSSSNHHDGLAQQQTSDIHVTGKINGAFDFTSPDHIVIPDHDDFSLGDGTVGSGTPFSISVWVYMHSAVNFKIVSKGVYNTDGEWRFDTGGDEKIRINIFDESVDNCYIGRRYDTVLTAYENQWIHLIMTYDGGKTNSAFSICLNGVRVDDVNHSQSSASFVATENLNHDVWIGRYGTQYTNGLIDNVAFFSKVLTIDEIKILHSAGHGTEIMADLDESRRIQRRPIWRR